MFCKECKNKLVSIDLYCSHCGNPTVALKQHFNIKNVLTQASKSAQTQKESFYFFNLSIALLILFVVYLAHFQIIFQTVFYNYIFLNISVVLLSPFLLLSFATIPEQKNLPDTFQFYPKLLLFTTSVALYFATLKIICQGDPILNLVRFILVLWGLAIAFPIPFLIFNHSKHKGRLIFKAYLAGKYLRWQQFALCVILGFCSLVSIWLPSSLVFIGNTMYIWYKKQNEFELYQKNKDY